MRTRLIVTLLAAAGAAPACDVTGWPSTTHHPSPAKPVAEMQLEVSWSFDDDMGMPESSRVAAIRAIAGAATVYASGDPAGLRVLFPASVTEWSDVQSAVNRNFSDAMLTSAPSVRAEIRIPEGAAPRDLERSLLTIPGLGISRVIVHRHSVVLEFPPGVPYPAPAVWRARRYLAAAPKG